MSLLITPLGVADAIYFKDYWRPVFTLNTGLHFGIESFIFAFSIGGIASVIYDEVFGMKYVRARKSKRPKHFLITITLLSVVILILNSIIFRTNSIYITSALMLLVGSTVTFMRHDLLKDALMSGLLTGLLMLIFYTCYFLIIFPSAIQNWWLLNNLSGIFVFGVPLEEILWGFCWGFIAGPIYEFTLGIKIARQ